MRGAEAPLTKRFPPVASAEIRPTTAATEKTSEVNESTKFRAFRKLIIISSPIKKVSEARPSGRAGSISKLPSLTLGLLTLNTAEEREGLTNLQGGLERFQSCPRLRSGF